MSTQIGPLKSFLPSGAEAVLSWVILRPPCPLPLLGRVAHGSNWVTQLAFCPKETFSDALASHTPLWRCSLTCPGCPKSCLLTHCAFQNLPWPCPAGLTPDPSVHPLNQTSLPPCVHQDTRHTTHVAQNTYSTSVPGRWPVIVPSCLAPVPLCVSASWGTSVLTWTVHPVTPMRTSAPALC